MWQTLGHSESVFKEKWPEYDRSKLKEDMAEVAVQLNGKVKLTIKVNMNEDKNHVLAMAKEALGTRLNGTVVKEIYVPNKIVNIVVKPN